MACRPDRHSAWMKRETTGRATAPTRRTQTLAADPTPTTSAPGPSFRNQTKAHRQETCSPTVFRGHRPAQTRLNTPHRPRRQDRQRLGRDRRRRDSRHHLKTPPAHPTTAPRGVDLSVRHPATARNSAGPAARVQLSVPSSAREAPTTLWAAVDRRSWAPQALRSTGKDTQWVDPVT